MNAGFTSPLALHANGAQDSVIAYASSSSAPLQQALATLYLPHLQQVLTRMVCVSEGLWDPENPAQSNADEARLMPHESVLKLWGHTPNEGQDVLITPCHWQVGMNEVVMLKPSEMHLTEAESQALLATMHPYFAEDGLDVTYESPLVWRASGAMFDNLPLAALDRAVGRNVNPWLPSGDKARHLQRLQSEMQMLLYQHPVNDQRSQQGRWTVNSFWVYRALHQLYPAFHASPAKLQPQVHLGLQAHALEGRPELWREQWQSLDGTLCQSLLASLARQQDVSLTLCSETAWRHYRPQTPSVVNKLKRWLSPISITQELRALTQGAPAP